MSKDNKYYALDLETTGLNPKLNKITEIGVVLVEDGVICDRYETLVKPGVKLTPEVTKITGITDDMLKDATEPADAIRGLLDFMKEDYPLLGHGILFDYAFLKVCAVNNGIPFQRDGICTLMIARAYYPQLESKSLPSLSAHFGLKHVSHRAMEDALAAHELYQLFREDCLKNKMDEKILQAHPLNYQVKKQVPATASQKERLKNMIARHALQVPYEIDTLTKSEASRYIDKIILKYGKGN